MKYSKVAMASWREKKKCLLLRLFWPNTVLAVRRVRSLCASGTCLSVCSQHNACKQIGQWPHAPMPTLNTTPPNAALAVAMASYCASSKENSNAYTFIIFKPCPYNMALFLKMKSINESEIQESTSPCASHVHIQHLETDNIYFSQTSTGFLMSERTFQQWSLVH